MPSGHIVRLPGGYVEEAGRVDVEVEVGPLTSAAEEAIAEAPADACSAELTTMLLVQTVRRIGEIREITPALIRGLLVEDREFLLARLRESARGPEMWIRLECPNPECGKPMDLKLRLKELPVAAREIRSRYFELELPTGRRVEFRLPTGGDQEWAASLGITDPTELRDRLLGRCLRENGGGAVASLGEEACGLIEQRMEELAPDVTPELDAVCPECGQAFTTPIDLGFLVLRELAGSRRRLEREIHLLAWHYHWSEREILDMPRRRRERYVRLIEEELETVLEA